MAREMLKLRKGDTAIMIKADGKIELAGVQDKELVDEDGKMSPVILFAAAWARRDQAVMNVLIENFKQAVREGLFGADAQTDLKTIEVEAEKNKIKSASEAAKVLNEQGLGKDASPEQINEALGNAKKKVDREYPVFEANMTPEEKAKKDREDAKLEHIRKQGQDPRVKRQQDAMKAGATKVETKPYDRHLEPDLPVEQTMAYQKATPTEQAEMKEAEKQKQIIGTATIEEKKDNEN